MPLGYNRIRSFKRQSRKTSASLLFHFRPHFLLLEINLLIQSWSGAFLDPRSTSCSCPACNYPSRARSDATDGFSVRSENCVYAPFFSSSAPNITVFSFAAPPDEQRPKESASSRPCASEHDSLRVCGGVERVEEEVKCSLAWTLSRRGGFPARRPIRFDSCRPRLWGVPLLVFGFI